MTHSVKLKRGESVIYIIIWLVILLMPVFFSNTSSGIDWSRVRREWIRLMPFMILFLIHNYVLFPGLFEKDKQIWYFISTIALIIIVGFCADFIGELLKMRPLESMKVPRHGEIPPGDLPMMDRIPPPKKLQPWHKMLFDNVIVSVLVVGFNAAIKIGVKWQTEEQKNKELEKEKLQTELSFLKNQVSPHFLMNTLNNIHALIDIKSEDAKASVIKLSKLMRYLLYDSEEGKTTLGTEVEFIKNYVDLMKLRFTDQVKIHLSFPENIPKVKIPPMLFTSLLENAFKHGVSYKSDSFVEIVMRTDSKFVHFRVVNSKVKSDNSIKEPGGVGLENLKKRLDLLYKNNYRIEQREDNKNFDIYIKLPLNG